MNVDMKTRFSMLISLIVMVPIGLATKVFPIEDAPWIQASLGGSFYVAFFVFSVLMCLPRARPWVVSLAVLSATFGVEFLQLWHPTWLDAIRNTRAGGLLLGSTFYWGDLPWYVIGAMAAWLWASLITRRFRQSDAPEKCLE